MKSIQIFFLFIGLIIQAQQKSIPFFDTTATVDGKLNEITWQNAATFTNFNNFFPDDVGLAVNQTKVRVYHNGKSLFIAAEYYDKTPESKVSTLKRDNHGDVVVRSDAFGLILDPFNKENNGYYFILNAANTQVDALVDFNGTDYNLNESWNAVWKSKTATEGTTKIYEIEIPFKALNFDVTNTTWGIQFFYRDFKTNLWMTYTDVSRNFFQFDLRFTEDVVLENPPKTSNSRFVVSPSITYNFNKDVAANASTSNIIPSVDAQYNITSSLRLDASINPDFSQVDVDQQVVNLTRFAINFPERRNFFLENSDLFNNLGATGINPFYSRIIGGTTPMQFGLKLSGNVSSNTRIGVLNAQTESETENPAQNYTVLVGAQKLSKALTTTAYLVNRQETEGFNFKGDFNRVFGINMNYKSKNNKWSGLANFGKSFTDNVSGNTNFFNAEAQYSTRKVFAKGAFRTVDKNFIADVGFVPRLNNYDAINGITIREGYSSTQAEMRLIALPENSKTIQYFRYLFPSNTTYWDEEGKVTQSSSFINQALFFRNASSVFINFNHEYINLKYGFDPLQNGKFIQPDQYSFGALRVGYNSPFNKNVSYRVGIQHGDYYNGNRTRFYTFSTFRFLPYAKIGADYEVNYLDLEELGIKPFHLARFTGEIFFNNRLNWTTYVQYNTQRNNFNINSRVQWEYNPLSYIYFVITDNFDQHIYRTNWGVSFKMNYRFDF
ncbi:DUF5916 domain-containing protein [Tenacibaculum sp. M341]|uniref:DUF5916 domain-containing protein n=1 Tax=Tenacibaculum sp. M341 TaxID=2530339 RepID=UPI00104EA1E5|nr:DUF5916 domain-containing protein [Tenacibaculum sp. M341]TCI90198.1 hypothetical protein EYW44_14795 [Tenacibaculum sp. M341]